MKIFRKNKQQQTFAEQNESKAKSVILQTYFTSLLSLVLCVSMFMGTSYAWFTSEVSSVSNEINVGILDVGLYKVVNGEEVALTGKADSEKLLNSGIRWEPGYTAIETLKVKNEGDLAFKYELSFTDGQLSEGTPADIAKHFDVWLFVGDGANPASYADIIAENSGWTRVGTLEELLAGKPVMKEKNMKTVRDADPGTAANARTADGVATTDTYKIAIHMSEEASNNSVMGCRITLNVKLVAYQTPSETDAFGTQNYDKVAVDAASLKTLLGTGETVLIKDIALSTSGECVAMNGGTLDGKGKKISYFGDKLNDVAVGVLTTSGGKITNLTINGNDNGGALSVASLTSDLTVSDCTFSGAYAFGLSGGIADARALNFQKTIFNATVSYENAISCATFEGCTFKAVLKPCGTTVLNNCTIEKDTLDVSALAAGKTITLTGCTYNGVAIEKAVFTAAETTVEGGTAKVTVTCDNSSLKISEEGIVTNAQ